MSNKKNGRPKKEIDQTEFEKLCVLQCTEDEICDWFSISKNKLLAWCKETYKKSFCDIFRLKKGKGKISLRRMQWKLAENNVAMAIFLGKQYLNQTDKKEIEFSDNQIKEIKMI